MNLLRRDIWRTFLSFRNVLSVKTQFAFSSIHDSRHTSLLSSESDVPRQMEYKGDQEHLVRWLASEAIYWKNNSSTQHRRGGDNDRFFSELNKGNASKMRTNSGCSQHNQILNTGNSRGILAEFTKEDPFISMFDAINAYLGIIQKARQLNLPALQSTQMEHFIQRIKSAITQEEILLIVFLKACEIIRNEKLKKNLILEGFNLQTFLKQNSHVCFKFKLISVIKASQEFETQIFFINQMILFIYDFHIEKLHHSFDMTRLNDSYDSLLSLSAQINMEPRFSFALLNVAMLSNIKLKHKEMFQRIKIHNSRFFRRCFANINEGIEEIDDHKWVYLLFKLTTFDHLSFGYNFEKFWVQQEMRLLRRFDYLSMVQKKSALYSIGKQRVITQATHELFTKLLDLKSLNACKHEELFLDYFANILISGMARDVIEKSQMTALLPFIKEVLSNKRTSDKIKLEFVSSTCNHFLRLGMYDPEYWDFFFAYEHLMLADPQKLFNCHFISKTAPAFADKIENKSFLTQIHALSKRIQAHPNYEQHIKKLLYKMTQVRQSLFEMRFASYLNAFGRPFTQEQIIEDVFSLDFYLTNEKIGVEIEGHLHFIQQLDGTFKPSPITAFKKEYLERIGIKVINLGSQNHNCSHTKISLLRSFLLSYNEIVNSSHLNQEQSKQSVQD